MNLVASPYAMNQVLVGLKVQLSLVAAPKCHLYQNDFTPTSTSVVTDFTEATFDGYAAVNLPYSSGPFRNVDGSFTIRNEPTFTMTGSTTPNIIYGAYITDSTGTNLLFSGRFATPVSMVDAFSSCPLLVSLDLPVNGLAGGPRVVS